MPKSLSSFLEECRREIPNEIIRITRTVDPAHYDVSAIIKHLGAHKQFPIVIFERPLNLHGQVSEFQLVMNCEISQRKTQIALGLPREMTRAEMAEACMQREAHQIPPIIVDKNDAPVKQVVKRGSDVDLYVSIPMKSPPIPKQIGTHAGVNRQSEKSERSDAGNLFIA